MKRSSFRNRLPLPLPLLLQPTTPIPTINNQYSMRLPSLYTTFTFYRFCKWTMPPSTLVSLAKESLLASFPGLRGTVVFAKEGLNGQLTIPTKDVKQFHQALGKLDTNLENIFLNIGETKEYPSQETLPFKKLVIKEKSQILTDGFERTTSPTPNMPIDWSKPGPELSPSEWHEEIASIDESGGKKVVLLDCRNDYESNKGTFVNAVPLNTKVFSESFAVLDSMLDSLPRDTPIRSFCTGGIRCVKTNAYIQQKLGFHNTARLANGIVAYENWVKENNLQEKSVFQGENFVFDRRQLE